MRTESPTVARGAFSDAHAVLLLDLLRIPTVTPMETGSPSAIREAQDVFAERALAAGFTIALHEPAPVEVLGGACVPAAVLEAADRMGRERFLACQPNLVLRFGAPAPRERTLMFNVHMDTVGGDVAVGAFPNLFTGRGAIDMKGPAVALLAGLETAVVSRPDIGERISILVHCVSGEEGGAMGSYGTRVLVERGLIGALNVFAEPTGGAFQDHCTATMTAAVEVRGTGATDDHPDAGHNATLLLGWIAVELAEALDGRVSALGGKLCVAGLHTGLAHDRIFGEGRLLINVAYASAADGAVLADALEAAFARARVSFAERFGDLKVGRLTADAVGAICSMRWLKRDLPALDNRDREMEALLRRAGISRSLAPPFTCDAIWGPRHSVVLGPGSLLDGGAHAGSEHVSRRDLERYAMSVARLVHAFDDAVQEKL